MIYKISRAPARDAKFMTQNPLLLFPRPTPTNVEAVVVDHSHDMNNHEKINTMGCNMIDLFF